MTLQYDIINFSKIRGGELVLKIDKRAANFLVIALLTFATFVWTFFIFHAPLVWDLIVAVIAVRILASYLIFQDYSLSWSKSTPKTFLIKTLVYTVAFVVYAPFFYGEIELSFMVSELLLYLFVMSFAVYFYYFLINNSRVKKDKTMVIFGAGSAGVKLKEEFSDSEYKIKYFVDDDVKQQKRSIDGIKIISKYALKEKLSNGEHCDLLVVAIPSASKKRIKELYERMGSYVKEIKVLPSLEEILSEDTFSSQLKNLTVEDLMARNPKDLDKEAISKFLFGKVVLITGAGGSIGSEIARQCKIFGVKKLIVLDHSEFNLYSIEQELESDNDNAMEIIPVMQSVVKVEALEKTFLKHAPQIVIHAAAYKHVPMVESNIEEAIVNNVLGTKNVIDIAVKHAVEKVILISTDKAVRPTNVMGTTKRICELYAQNSNGNSTDIVAVRFGNVLGSSGSVIPKFMEQIEKGKNITVTHPDITRYFMLIPEACELVLQAGAIGTGGEIFILDMGEPVKIADLAQKMINLSGHDEIEIEFTGLRPGEKLYEELLFDEAEAHTQYESITVGKTTHYDIERLNKDIAELIHTDDKLKKLKEIVPEFDHKLN